MKKTLLLLLALALCAGLFLPGSSQALHHEVRNFWIEEDSLHSLAVFGGQLYGLGGKGLYRLDLDSGELHILGDLQECREDHILFDSQQLEQLFADDQGLLAFDSYSNQLFRLDLEAEPVARDLLCQVETGTEEALYLAYPCFDAPYFYGYAFDRQTCYRVDITTGEVKTLEVEHLRATAPLGEGRLLAITSKQDENGWQSALSALDFEAGSLEQFAILPDIPNPSLAYDAAKQIAYTATRNRLLAFHQGEADPQPLSYIPGGDNNSLVLLPGYRAALITAGNLVAVRPLNPDAKPAQALTLLDPIALASHYRPFMKLHPDTELIFISPEPASPEERFAADMASRNPEVDIYLLRDPNLLGQIKQKGYFLDLAASPGIREAVAHLEPGFQEAITQEGQLAAVLKEVYVGTLIGNPKVFEHLGQAAPTSFLGYYQFCLDYIKHHQADMPEYDLAPFENSMDLGRVLVQVAAEMIAQGRPLDFENPEMKQLVGRINQVARARQHETPQAMDQVFSTSLLPLLPKGTAPLLLSFQAEQAPLLPSFPDGVEYLVVNPYTRNREAALAFMESYIENLPTPQRLLMDTRAIQPIEQPQYQARLAHYQAQIQALKTSLQGAEGTERSQLEEMIAEFESMAQQLTENERWWFDQEQVDQVRAFAPRVFIPEYNPVSQLLKTNPGFFAEITTNSRFDVDGFLARLNQMVQTILKEQE